MIAVAVISIIKSEVSSGIISLYKPIPIKLINKNAPEPEFCFSELKNLLRKANAKINIEIAEIYVLPETNTEIEPNTIVLNPTNLLIFDNKIPCFSASLVVINETTNIITAETIAKHRANILSLKYRLFSKKIIDKVMQE